MLFQTKVASKQSTEYKIWIKGHIGFGVKLGLKKLLYATNKDTTFWDTTRSKEEVWNKQRFKNMKQIVFSTSNF